MDYSKEDIEKLANAVINNWEDYNVQSRYLCRYCAGYHGKTEKPTIKCDDGFPHDLDCPVLIAQDVLTDS